MTRKNASAFRTPFTIKSINTTGETRNTFTKYIEQRENIIIKTDNSRENLSASSLNNIFFSVMEALADKNAEIKAGINHIIFPLPVY
jgi:hypothetical protein